MIGRIRWPVLRILRWERRGWKTKERDSTRKKEKATRKAEPTLSHGYHPPNGRRGGKILAWRFALFFFRNEKRVTDTSMTGGVSAQLK